jgi:hypothetical protein
MVMAMIIPSSSGQIYNHELKHSVKDTLNLKGLTIVELINT